VVYKTTTDRYGIKNKIEVNRVIIHGRKKKLFPLHMIWKRYLQILRDKLGGLDHSFPIHFVSKEKHLITLVTRMTKKKPEILFQTIARPYVVYRVVCRQKIKFPCKWIHNIFFWKELNTRRSMHAAMLCAFSFQGARISCFGNHACCHRINMTALTTRYLRRLSVLCVRRPTDNKHCHLFTLTSVPTH
jgi:hypothetical protein